MKGFSLIEILLAIGIFVLLVGLTLPYTIDAYRTYVLDAELRNFVSILRRAQAKAISNEGLSKFGVKVKSDNFVLFRGSDFNSRNSTFDEKFPREQSVDISGFDELTFKPLSGFASTTQNVIVDLQSGDQERSLSINRFGTIAY